AESHPGKGEGGPRRAEPGATVLPVGGVALRSRPPRQSPDHREGAHGDPPDVSLQRGEDRRPHADPLGRRARDFREGALQPLERGCGQSPRDRGEVPLTRRRAWKITPASSISYRKVTRTSRSSIGSPSPTHSGWTSSSCSSSCRRKGWTSRSDNACTLGKRSRCAPRSST